MCGRVDVFDAACGGELCVELFTPEVAADVLHEFTLDTWSISVCMCLTCAATRHDVCVCGQRVCVCVLSGAVHV